MSCEIHEINWATGEAAVASWLTSSLNQAIWVGALQTGEIVF